MSCNFYCFAIYLISLFVLVYQLYLSLIKSRDEPGFQAGGGGPEISKKKFSNTHPYSINKLSTKTNIKIQSSTNKNKTHETLLRYNHPELGNEYFLELEHPHFLELE